MNISSVGATTPTATNQSVQSGTRPPRGNGPFEVVSSLLGMSADDIASKVADGTSLQDLADQAGVAREDLLSALKENAPPRLRASADIDTIVARIATQTGAGPGPGGPGGPGGAGRPPGPPPAANGVLTGSLTADQTSTLDLLGSLLDMSTDDLASSLSTGTDLASLLQSREVDLASLAGALQAGFLIDARA